MLLSTGSGYDQPVIRFITIHCNPSHQRSETMAIQIDWNTRISLSHIVAQFTEILYQVSPGIFTSEITVVSSVKIMPDEVTATDQDSMICEIGYQFFVPLKTIHPSVGKLQDGTDLTLRLADIIINCIYLIGAGKITFKSCV